MTKHFSFEECLHRAERITWRVEDVMDGRAGLDFAAPFMPESLARTDALTFLDPGQRLTLNHIRGHAYLAIFGLVEEFILPFVLDHARPFIPEADFRARAFLEFAGEEAKHIQLFRRFRQAFVHGFGTACQVIGPTEAVSRHVLSHPPLSVALLILHIEWMTQRHFLDSVRDDRGIDTQFKSLLLHHWMEEHQHAQLDAQMVEMIAALLTPQQIEAGIDGYLTLGIFLDEGLKQQTAYDLSALEVASGRVLTGAERETFTTVQHQANRWTYIGSGMSHPRFLESVAGLNPAKARMIEALAPTFS